MSYPNRGGRIPPDNRPAQAKGVGQNSKRHDLERRTTPFLHDSDLQQGDVQAMENGQRITAKQTQQPAAPSPTGGSGKATEPVSSGTTGVPDAIDFIAGIGGKGGVNPPGPAAPINPNADKWARYARHLANGPGASGLLGGAYINQMRQLMRSPQAVRVEMIDLADVDEALAVALDAQEEFDAGAEDA